MAGHGKRSKRIHLTKGIRKRRIHTKRSKASKRTCALTGTLLHGTPHGKRVAKVRKMSRSSRRPAGMFGGILGSKARTMVFEDAIRVKIGLKELDEIPLNEKKFVEQALQHLNKK